MHVSTRGTGEPLVLLHGIGDSHATWTPLLEALAARFTVHAVDLPGFGRSPRLPAQTVPALARAVAEAIGGTFHVGGNSLGARIGFELAELGVARSLTAFSPAGFNRGPLERAYTRTYLRAYNGMIRAGAPALGVVTRSPIGRKLAAAPMFVHGERAGAQELAARARQHAADSAAFRATLDAATDDPVVREPPGVPVTVAWGVLDFLLPYAIQARRARQVLPKARHVRLDGAGHIPMADQPERCTELIVTTAAPSPGSSGPAGPARASARA